MALVRAVPILDFRATALSTTDVSTGYNISSTGKALLYGTLHVSSGYNSTARVMSMLIQSASSSGFGGATTRMTFTLSTAQSAEWGTPVAPSTDHPWWRASWVMSTAASTGGTWKGLVSMGLR